MKEHTTDISTKIKYSIVTGLALVLALTIFTLSSKPYENSSLRKDKKEVKVDSTSILTIAQPILKSSSKKASVQKLVPKREVLTAYLDLRDFISQVSKTVCEMTEDGEIEEICKKLDETTLNILEADQLSENAKKQMLKEIKEDFDLLLGKTKATLTNYSKEEQDKIRKKLAEDQKKLEVKLRNTITEQARAINIEKQKNNHLSKDLKSMEKTNSKLKEEFDVLSRKYEDVLTETKKLRQSSSQSTSNTAVLESLNRQIQNQLNQINSQSNTITDQGGRIQRLLDQKEELMRQLELASITPQPDSKVLEQLRLTEQRLVTQGKKLQYKIDSLNRTIVDLQTNATNPTIDAATLARIDRLQNELKELTGKNQALLATNEQLKIEIQRLETDNEQLKQEKQKLIVQKQELEQKIQMLESKILEMSGLIDLAITHKSRRNTKSPVTMQFVSPSTTGNTMVKILIYRKNGPKVFEDNITITGPNEAIKKTARLSKGDYIFDIQRNGKSILKDPNGKHYTVN